MSETTDYIQEVYEIISETPNVLLKPQSIERAKRIHALYQSQLSDLRAENERANKQIKWYVEAFIHTHKAKYDGDKLLDECDRCGLDLRDEMHRRIPTQ